MSSLDQFLNRLPKLILAFLVIVTAIGVMVYLNPLRQGCDVEIRNLKRNVRGYLFDARTKKNQLKIAEVTSSKDFCREGNSQGACGPYFSTLKKITDALVPFEDRCIFDLKDEEAFGTFEAELRDGVKIMALVAWGEKPPARTTERTGWLSQNDVVTFCRLKNNLRQLIGEEDFGKFRLSVYSEYPEDWPASYDQNMVDSEKIRKPLAFKSPANPRGSLAETDVYSKSLFSLPCDISR